MVSREESIQKEDAHVPALSADTRKTTDWFAERVGACLTDNVRNLTIFGPAVTEIYDASEHQIHALIVIKERNVDQLLSLAKCSEVAASRRLSPPLIVTETALRQSQDVFPLEWLDIVQFHVTVLGEPILTGFQPNWSHVRLQCERELRSLDILLQRGILASGGKPDRIDRLEDEASDSLIRVLRGIGWLSGDRKPLLPTQLCRRCGEIVGISLPGCLEAIRVDGEHNVETVRLLLSEIGSLSHWIDACQPSRS